MSALNLRARDALRGEWLPGMVDTEGRRVDGISVEQHWWGPYYVALNGIDSGVELLPADACPDLDDPVTELALIAVLERRTSGPVWADRHPRAGLPDWRVTWRSDGHTACVRGATRKDALLAALEAT